MNSSRIRMKIPFDFMSRIVVVSIPWKHLKMIIREEEVR